MHVTNGLPTIPNNNGIHLALPGGGTYKLPRIARARGNSGIWRWG